MNNHSEYQYTNQELKKIIETHLHRQGYRREYYKNKYHSDLKYKNYQKDYQKIRYEERKFVSYYTNDNYEELSNKKACNLYKWFHKRERDEEFKEKCPEDYKIYLDYINSNT